MALTAQTIEAFVGDAMDEARMGPLHWRLLGLVRAGYLFDVLDFTIFGALVPDLIRSGFVIQQQVPWIGSITLLGLFIGTLGQGEFTDRYGAQGGLPVQPVAVWARDDPRRPAADPEHRVRARSHLAADVSISLRR